MSQAIDSFFAAWGETDAEARAKTLRGCLSPNITYLDPRLKDPLTGIDALVEYVAMYTQYAPGATAQVIGKERQGQNLSATVAFRMDDGKVQHGLYMIEVDAKDRPTRMVGKAAKGDTV